MNVLVLLEHKSQVVNVVLQVSSLLSVFFMDIGVSSLVLDLFFDVFLVQSDDSGFQLLEVCDMVEHFEDIVLEFLLVALLLVELLSEVLDLGGQTLLSHSEIINDKGQVLVHPIEVFQLLPHLVSLLVERLDLELSWTDVTLQLLALVVKNEFEFFKLLSLLFKINDTFVLVPDGLLSFLELIVLASFLLLELTDDLDLVR